MRKNSKSDRPLTGQTVLELFVAAVILLGPSVLENAARGWGLYVLLALTAAVFAVRVIETKKVHISVNTVLGMLCAVYALFVLFWASGIYGNVRLIFIILTLTLGGMLTADYLEREKGPKLESRLEGLFTGSAFICAVWNLAAWVIADRFSLTEPLHRGLGGGDLLGAYMLVGLWCCSKTFAPKTVGRSSRGRRRKKSSGAKTAVMLPMVLTLILSRCFLTGIFAGIGIILFCAHKKNKGFCVIGGGLSALSAAGLVLFGKPSVAPFGDALISGLTHPGGLGGGGFIIRQGELQSGFYQVNSLGAGAEFISSLGIAGLIAALMFVGWAGYLAISCKSRASAAGALMCGLAFFTKPGIGALMLLMGFLVYGEWRLEKTMTFRLGAKYIIPVAAVGLIAVYGCVLTAGEAFKAAGRSSLEKGDALAAAGRLSAAVKLNPLDGEGCALAAQAYLDLYNDGGVKNNIVNAEYYIKLAIGREERRAPYYAENAEIMAAAGDPAQAVELDRRALELAPLWDDGRVKTAEHLYALIQTMEKGSYQAQSCHKEILALAGEVEDLERQEQIMNFETKAQPYTRIEYSYDGAEDGEGSGYEGMDEADSGEDVEE